MKTPEEIETQLKSLNHQIDFEIKNPPTDDKKVNVWVTNLGRLDGKRQALKWVLNIPKERKAKIEIPPSQNAINAKNYLDKMRKTKT